MNEPAPALLTDGATGYSGLLHGSPECLDIRAHEIELMPAIRIRRMNRNFRRRQTKDQPAMSGIDVRQSEYIPEEGAVGQRIAAVENRMCTDEHWMVLSIEKVNHGLQAKHRSAAGPTSFTDGL